MAVTTLFAACNKDCDHNFIEHDYSKDIVGTWTVLLGNYTEAVVINADGTMNRTFVYDGEIVEQSLRYELVSNQITLFYENGDVEKGRIDVVPDVGLSITIDDEAGLAYKYFCCEKDFSDEIIGMWVCTETPSSEQNDMLIMTYNADGTTLFTGYAYEADVFSKNVEASYKVIGDLLIHKQPDIAVEYGLAQYNAMKIKYTPNATSLGDVMSLQAYAKVGEDYVETNTAWLRIKQSLNLMGTYDYNTAYVTNAKGKDEDFYILDNTFNMTTIEGGDFDVVFGADLYCVELNANSIKHKFRPDGQHTEIETPITVEGNKVTLDMSAVNPALRKVEMYMFQDKDDSQLHMYMYTDAFINYFANLEVITLIADGKINQTDTAAVEKVFADMEARVENINVSFVFKARE